MSESETIIVQKVSYLYKNEYGKLVCCIKNTLKASR